jgi:hypothetical protein
MLTAQLIPHAQRYHLLDNCLLGHQKGRPNGEYCRQVYLRMLSSRSDAHTHN